jgi:hypothetical protein
MVEMKIGKFSPNVPIKEMPAPLFLVQLIPIETAGLGLLALMLHSSHGQANSALAGRILAKDPANQRR